MNGTTAERNIATIKELLEDAMPNLDWDLIPSLVPHHGRLAPKPRPATAMRAPRVGSLRGRR